MSISLAPHMITIMWVMNVAGVLTVYHLERDRARSALMWAVITVLVPYVGVAVYLLYGHAMQRARPSMRRKEDADLLRMEAISRDREPADANAVLPCIGIAEYRGLAEMLNRNGSWLSEGNSAELFNWGEDKFDSLFRDVGAARDHVHMEYYIIRDDRLGNDLLDLLSSKAKEGVEVRLLVDALGTRLPPKTFKALERSGVEVATYFPAPYRHLPFLNFRINHRNHRKIMVADGRVGYVGGYNVGDEYLGKGKLGAWRDSHIRLEGPAVLDLQARFFLDWDFASDYRLNVSPRYFPDVSATGGSPVQIISDGPDKARDVMQEAYLKMVCSAQSRIYIQSPYFIPDQSVMDALKVAASSGMDVRVMIPVKPDHPFVHWANLSYLGELLEFGARGFLYEDGFLHAKTIVVDGLVTSIGSANWDIRSLELNFETNALLYSPRMARKQEEAFLSDMERCREWTLDDLKGMSAADRLRCGVSGIFAPLL